MYLEHFGFREKPFSIAPNPQFLYMSPRHQEALAHLIYGLSGEGGFVILTGEVGTGKTTLCRCMIDQLPEHVDTAFLLNPTLTAPELLATICDDFGIEYPEGASLKVLGDRINTFLLSSVPRDRKAVLIIDEAQNLSVNVLEQLRLLTNLETNEEKLLQIILLGQEELIDLLGKEELRQLEQRVTARFHLTALSADESAAYIGHRLQTAGGDPELFKDSHKRHIHHSTRGVPRLINVVCDRALLGAYAEGVRHMSMTIVRKAVRETLADPRRKSLSMLPWAMAAAAVAGALAMAVVMQSALPGMTPPNPVSAAQVSVPTPQEPAALAHAPAPASPTSNPTPSKPEPVPVQVGPEPLAVGFTTPTVIVTPEPIVESELLIFSGGDASLLGLDGFTRRADAFVAIFGVWGTNFDPARAEPCTKAVSVGLRCFFHSGKFEDILQLDRPTILTLSGDRGHVALMFVSGNTAFVTDRSGERQIALDSLKAAWEGPFTLLWRMPPGYTGPMDRGDSGTAVDWLNYQLDLMNGKSARLEANTRFDADLEARVESLQAAHGIDVDGIAGAETWITVNAFEGLGIPFLTDRAP